MSELALHTNEYKKIVFFFGVPASMYFNVLLFGSIGENIAIRSVWAIVGIGAVFFQALQLRLYHNTKKRGRYRFLVIYGICTIGSLAGTLGAGYAHIEKTKLSGGDKSEIIKTIDLRIEQIKNKDKESVNAEIEALRSQFTNLTYKVAERSVLLNNEIERKRKQARITDEEFKEIEILSARKAELKKDQASIVNSISGIAKMLRSLPIDSAKNMTDELVAFIFLCFVAAMVELMVYGGASFHGSLFRQKKKVSSVKKHKKNKDTGQLSLFSA